jgi:hypothetical protein
LKSEKKVVETMETQQIEQIKEDVYGKLQKEAYEWEKKMRALNHVEKVRIG